MRNTILVFMLLVLMGGYANAAPVLLGSSAVAGDNNNWPGNNTRGAAITVWGYGLGSSGTLTCCGVTMNSTDSTVAEWNANTNPKTPQGIGRITFWLTSGMSGNAGIYVTVSSQNSNTLPFQISDIGSIYLYPSDKTGQGWSDMEDGLESLVHGDFFYIEAGSYDETIGKIGSDYSAWHVAHSTNRVTIAAYPGAAVTFEDGMGFELYTNYWTVANIRFEITDASVWSGGHENMYELDAGTTQSYDPDEDFTEYNEVDTPGRVSVSSSSITITNLDTDEDVYVVREGSGAPILSGDPNPLWEGGFVVSVRFNIASLSSGSNFFVWAFATANNDDIQGQINGNKDVLCLRAYESGGSYYVRLEEHNNGVQTNSSAQQISLSTPYFITIRRDEEVGTYGRVYGHLYDNQTLPISETNYIVGLELNLTEKKDYSYWYAMSSANSATGGDTISATIGKNEHRIGLSIGNWFLGNEGFNNEACSADNYCHTVNTTGNNQKIMFNYDDFTPYPGGGTNYVYYVRAGSSYQIAYNELRGGGCWSLHLSDETRKYNDNCRHYYDCIVEGNLIEGVVGANADGAFIFRCKGECKSNPILIRNNVFFSQLESGLSALTRFSYDVDNAKFYNNTLYKSGGAVGIETLQSDVTVNAQNNIFYDIDSYDVTVNYGTVNLDYNLYDGSANLDGALKGAHAIENADPRFTNDGNLDFSLQSDSDAIDVGNTLSEVKMDRVGHSRPQGTAYDIGAYEYDEGGTSTTTIPIIITTTTTSAAATTTPSTAASTTSTTAVPVAIGVTALGVGLELGLGQD